MTTDTMRDRLEAEDRLNAIRDALHAVLSPAKPVYQPTAVELLMALNMRGLKIVKNGRCNAQPR